MSEYFLPLDVGQLVYDRWADESAHVVAGAQDAGYVTIKYVDAPDAVVVVLIRDLTIMPWGGA
jgi:hypothetical protein